MSAVPQRGRRRAETARRPSLLPLGATHAGTHSAKRAPATFGAATKTAKCMAAAAVLGALVTAGAVAQGISVPSHDLSAVSAVAATTADVQAPADAAISFPNLDVASSASPTATAPLKVEADAVKPVETPAPAPVETPAPVVVDDPAAAQAFAASQLGSFGWGPDQMSCLTQLWQRESEWLTSAENASSGAYGIAQSLPASKMESTGSDWATNYQTQIRWGLGYIEGRYGSPCSAWGHSNAVGWY